MYSILINGEVIDACLMMDAKAKGQELITIEDVASADGFQPLQEQFLEHTALQCGIYSPGFIVAAKALLYEESNPLEERIWLYLAGNLCHCLQPATGKAIIYSSTCWICLRIFLLPMPYGLVAFNIYCL